MKNISLWGVFVLCIIFNSTMGFGQRRRRGERGGHGNMYSPVITNLGRSDSSSSSRSNSDTSDSGSNSSPSSPSDSSRDSSGGRGRRGRGSYNSSRDSDDNLLFQEEKTEVISLIFAFFSLLGKT